LVVEFDRLGEPPLVSAERGLEVNRATWVEKAGVISAFLPESAAAGKSVLRRLIFVPDPESTGEERLGETL
jgi:hypothetical protein